MNIKSWKLWGALATAGVSVAVNLATEWKYNLLAWAAVPVLVGVAVWLGSMADQAGQNGVASYREQSTPLVLRYEERRGDARRTVLTTSERVATEFLKSVSPP